MMKSFSIKTASGVAGLALIYLSQARAGQENAAKTATARIVTAANSFLATLDQKQRQAVLFSFNDEEQRKRWSNFPVVMVPRGGISLKEMNATQRAAAMALVASTLSQRGFEKVQQIMEGDEVNKTTDQGPGGNRGPRRPGGPGGPPPSGPAGGPPGSRRGPGGPPFGNGPIFGKDLYYISMLGTPSETNPWMLQFGGHHLALNITIAGEHGVLTPTLTGAQPALYTIEGKTVRPLGEMPGSRALAQVCLTHGFTHLGGLELSRTLLGLDTDNGVEFINMELLAYCEAEQLTFTRGRPQKSNDQCYVEQKNGNVVRQVVGYDRFVGELAYRQLAELYRALRLYVNCFQPSMKLRTKERDGSRVRRTYDHAQTPMHTH